MKLNSLLESLGKRLQIDGFAVEGNDTCSIRVGDEIDVSVEAYGDAGECLIYSFLERVPEVRASELQRRMLQENLFGAATSDATLCLDDQTGRVVVYRKLDVEPLDEELFFEIWSRVVGLSLRWQARLTGQVDESPEISEGQQWVSV